MNISHNIRQASKTLWKLSRLSATRHVRTNIFRRIRGASRHASFQTVARSTSTRVLVTFEAECTRARQTLGIAS